MSRTAFDFLLDSFLLHDEAVQGHFRQYTDEQIQRELGRYREHVIDKLDALQEEVLRPEGDLSAYFGLAAATSQNSSPLEGAKRAAFYFDSVVLDDPLFQFTAPRVEGEDEFARYLGFAPRKALDREKLAVAAQQLLEVQPLIGADILKLAPFGLAHERPRHLPLSYSPRLFADRVPEPLLEWFHQRATVHPMFRLDSGGWGYRRDAELCPCRGIAVSFQEHERPMIVHLSAVKLMPHPDAPNRLTFTQWLPHEPPSDGQFRAWVEQSINQYAGDIYQLMAGDLVNAAVTHTMLVTDSPFISHLLGVVLDDTGGIQAELAQLAMQFDLPFLHGVGMADLVSVRNEEDEAFHAYRRALQAHLRDLRHLDSDDAIRERMKDVVHEFEEIQIPNIESALRSAQRKAVAGAALGVAGLATTVATGGLSVGALIVGAAHAAQGAIEYRETVRGHPAYFLWQLKKRVR